MTIWESRGGKLVVTDANASARELLGRPLAPGESAELVVEDPRLLLALVEVLAERRTVVLDELATGSRVLEARGHPLPDGRVGLVLLDVTAHHDARRHIGHLTRHDTLTGLGNRDEFLAMLGIALAEASDQDTRLAVMVLDLDRFKDVNDTLGHSQGDLLLGQVSRRLSQWQPCRVGGDEFALIVRPTVQPLEALAAQVASTFATPFPIGRLAIRATASVGVAAWPDHGDDAEDLMRKADVAMWSAKQSGRGVAVYRSEDDRFNVRRLTLVSDLRDAIEGGQLELHYQPKMGLAERRITGAEALVRWHHPQLGVVPPGEFVPLAEDSGLIGPLSSWVLEESGRQLAKWRDAGIDMNVSANISARNLYDPRLVRWLTKVFNTNELRPGQLTLELTETQVAEDLPMAKQILKRLQAVGAELSIDDFGTGYSSLSYLSRLPLDELKIDRSFVLDLDTDQGVAMVQTIIGLGHELNLRVVAEGVEQADTLDTLQELGCDVVQGHHLSVALPAPQLEDWLATQS